MRCFFKIIEIRHNNWDALIILKNYHHYKINIKIIIYFYKKPYYLSNYCHDLDNFLFKEFNSSLKAGFLL